MDNDGREQGQEQGQQQQFVERDDLHEELDMAANEEYVPMDIANATDTEDSSDEEYADDDEEGSDVDDQTEDDDDDEEDYGLDPVDIIGWMDTDGDEEDSVCTLKRFHRYFVQNRTEQIYKFKPLHLFKCNYKSLCDPCQYPTARSGHRIIASESHLYSLGGYNPNRPPSISRRNSYMLFQELWAYNFATRRWKLLLNAENVNMPKELASHAMVLYNNVLLSHGGTGYPFGETCSNDCHIFTINQKPQVMRLETSGDFPTAQYGPAVVVHNDYLYTIGGTTGFDYTCDIYRLNLLDRVWENVYICRPDVRDDPEGRYRHEVVYDGDYIYVLGGGTSNAVFDLQRLPAFNLHTNQWEYIDTLPDRTASTVHNAGFPKPRKCLSCVQYKTSQGDVEAFITGGLQGDITTYFDDIWKLNLRTKQWWKIHSATLPRPLYFHSAAHANNGCMYIFGGIEYSEKDMRRRNDLFKMWMTIPKLTEICWDAITFYNNHLHRYNRDTLLHLGIPERFVNRLPPQRHQKEQSQQLQTPDISRRLLGIE